VLAGGLMLGLVSASHAATVTFDFDTGAPSSTSTQLTYTLGGVTATFGDALDPNSYMIIGSNGLFVTLSNNVLMSDGSPHDLTISFDSPQSSITLDFAAFDTSLLTLSATLAGNPVGASSASGNMPPGNAVPENVLSFNAGNFDSVVLSSNTAQLALDNIAVTSAAASVPEPSSFLLGGGVLAILSLAARLRRKA
jgi:hypothetical protein